MHFSKMKKSRYIQSADVEDDVLVTITGCNLEQLDPESDEEKHVLHMQEFDKGLVLNWTNIQLLAKFTGCDDSDDWAGHQVILFHDETVQYLGKVVGGIRIRRAKKPSVVQDEGPNDPIPGWDDEEDVA